MLNEAVQIRPEFFRPLPNLSPALSGLDVGPPRAALEATEESFGAAFLLSGLGTSDVTRLSDAWAVIAEQHRDRHLATIDSDLPEEESEAAGLDRLYRKRYEAGLGILMPLARASKLSRQHFPAVAGALMRVQRQADVIDLFRGLDPQGPDELYLLATSYRHAALAQFEQMAQLDPNSPRAHQVLGDSYLAQQRLEQALGEYERAVELAPTNSELRYQVGSVLHRMNEYGRSAEVFGQVIGLDPLNAEAHVLRGEALVRLGRNDQAIRSMERGLDLKPKSAAAHVALGRAYRITGNDQEALRHLTAGASADRDGSVHYQLFLLYRELNRADEARAALAKSQQIRAMGR